MDRSEVIAALYVDPLGPYPKIDGVDSWDLSRDAHRYWGPFPVVAHPPCGPWGKLRQLYDGDDHALAFRGLEQVRRWGGVLEHPADSRLWSAYGRDRDPKKRGSQYMARPGEPSDCWGGFSIEVHQCEWGHVARKRTWLYLVGVPASAIEKPPFPGREPTHWASGSRNAPRGPVPPGIKVCSKTQRNRTPPLFAAYLVRLAMAARK